MIAGMLRQGIMNVVFIGTPEFAVPSLRALVTSAHNIIAVITQPDRPKGRSKTPCPSPVKEAAISIGLKIMQPVNINDTASVEEIKRLSPDCIVVVAFGQFLSNAIIRLPRYQCINIHASLLPKFRGAAPINWAIIKGETVTGVTAMLMTAKMDAGDIISTKHTPISPEENAGELEKRLSIMGAELLVETLDGIEVGRVTYTKQEENEVSFAPKIKKEDGLISWPQETHIVHNGIRGMSPSPGAYTYYAKSASGEKKRLVIVKTQIHDTVKTKTPFIPGTIIETAPCGIHVATLEGSLCVTRLQQEGKREMDAQEYLRGHQITAQDVLTS